MKIKKINSLNNMFVVFALLLSSFSYTMEIVLHKNTICSLVLSGEMEREQVIEKLDNILEQENYTFEDKQKLVNLFSKFVIIEFDTKVQSYYYRKIAFLLHPDRNTESIELFKELNSTNTLMKDKLKKLTCEGNELSVNKKRQSIVLFKNMPKILLVYSCETAKTVALSGFGYCIGSKFSGLLFGQPEAFRNAIKIQNSQIEKLSDDIEELLKQINQKKSASASK